MKELKGMWKLIWIDIRRSYRIFWSILLFFVGLGVIISLSFPQGEINWNMDGAVLIYQIVIGAQLFRIAFQYGSTFGNTRALMYVGSVSFILIISFISALIHNILYFSIRPLMGLLNVEMSFNSMLEMSAVSENFFSYLLTLFVIYVFFTTVSMLLSLVKNQVGSLALYAVAGVFGLTVFLPSLNTYWVEVFYWFAGASVGSIFTWFLILSALLLCLPLPFVKKFQIFTNEKVA